MSVDKTKQSKEDRSQVSIKPAINGYIFRTEKGVWVCTELMELIEMIRGHFSARRRNGKD